MRSLTTQKEGHTNYLTIGELARKLGREPQTIIGWERQGLISPPRTRTTRGWRLYSPIEVIKIEKVARKVRVGRYKDDRHPIRRRNQ
jgi:hypothetical protein